MTVETVDESLYRWFVNVTNVGCSLARFATSNNSLRVDKAEGVDDDFSFDGLDGVNDDCD